MTKCQCSQPGWCERHGCNKPAHWHKLCCQREDYFELWEQGNGPGQLKPAKPPLPKTAPASVAVVIISHNYGSFLETCIESVLAQTHRPWEILVVDDCSSDETPEIALKHADQGVKYLRVEYGHVHQTRRAGFDATESEALCFLDADDYLSPTYIEEALMQFTHKRVAVVYSDMELFGQRTGRTQFPAEFDLDLLVRDNFIHAGSVVRRAAIDVSKVFEQQFDPLVTQGDWFLWRRILRGNWTARKQQSLYFYRQHGQNWSRSMQTARAWDFYFSYAGLQREEITLFIPLSGRFETWKQLSRFLEQQHWPHDQIRLILLDTSQDERFQHGLRNWIAQCDYSDVRIRRESVATPGLADDNRREKKIRSQVVIAMWRIYNRMLEMLETDYVWILEDDVLPDHNVCERLMKGFDERTGAVAAPYRSRYQDEFVVWDTAGKAYSRAGSDYQTVGGSGFGCIVLRRAAIAQEVFVGDRSHVDYDLAFTQTMRRSGLVHKVDWASVCFHGVLQGHSNGHTRQSLVEETP